MQKIDNNSKGNKILKILIVILIILIIGVLSISFIFTQKQTAPSVFGYNIFVMNGKGMEPAIMDKSAIITKVGIVPEKGEVALCRLKLTGDKSIVTVMRVVEIETNDGQAKYYLKSDKNSNSGVIIAGADEIVGKADLEVHWLGVIISFATSRAGILLFIITPAALILISLLISIIKHNDDEIEEEEKEIDYIPSLSNINDDKETSETVLSDNNIDDIQESKPEEIIKEKKDKSKAKKPDIDDIVIPKRPEFIKEIEQSIVEDKAIDEPVVIADVAEKEVVTMPAQAPQEKEPDIIKSTITSSAHVTLDKDGKAEYNKMTPTANVSELEKILPQTPVNHSDLATKSIDNLLKSVESSRQSAMTKEQPKNTSNIENIAPEPKKTSTNKTLEEMMRLLDQQRRNLK